MDGMTTDSKLLAQDDIDALLGEAGLEGGYEAEKSENEKNQVKKSSPVKFSSTNDNEVREILTTLFNKAFLEREDDIKVIWNASGVIPMATGLNVKIQGIDYASLGIIHDKHLVVKIEGESNQSDLQS